MAVNKSDKPMNSIQGRFERESQKTTAMATQAAGEQARFQAKVEALRTQAGAATDRDLQADILGQIGPAEASANRWQETYQRRSEATQINALNRATTGFERLGRAETIGVDINRVAGSTDAYSAAQQFRGMSYGDLERQRMTAVQDASRASQRGLGLFESNIPAEEKQRRIAGAEVRREQAIGTAGAIDVQLRQMRQMGMDPMSRDLTFAQRAAGAARYTQQQDIATKVARGDIGDAAGDSGIKDMKGVLQAFSDVQREIIQKNKQLAVIFDKTGKTAEGLRGELDKLTKQSNQLGGVMGAGQGDQMRRAQRWQSAGEFAQAASESISEIMVKQPIAQARLRGEFAALGNQQFGDVMGAMRGDMKSLLMTQTWGDVEASSGRRFRAGQVTAGTAMVADIAGTVARTTSAGVSGGGTETFLGIGAGDKLKGLIDAGLIGAGGALRNIGRGVAIERGLPGGEAALQDAQATRKMHSQLFEIRSQNMQAFKDFEVGAAVAMRGLGGGQIGRVSTSGAFSVTQMDRKEAFLADMREARQAAANIGVTGAMQNQITAAGIQGLGAQFQARDVISLRQLERTGYGTIQQNLQRRQALQMLGAGQQDDLEEMIKMGTERGLNSSKAIDMMVQATVATAQGMANVGLDVGKNTAGIIASVAGADDPLAIRQATNALQFASANAGATNMTMASLMERQEVTGIFGGGLNDIQMLNVQKLNPQGIAALRGLRSTNKDVKGVAERFAFQMGFADPDEARRTFTEERLTKIAQSKVNKILTGGNVGMQEIDPRAFQIAKNLVAGEEISKKDESYIASTGFMKTDMIKALKTLSPTGFKRNDKGQLLDDEGNVLNLTGITVAGEKITEAPAKAEFKQITVGMNLLGGKIENLATIMDEMTDAFDAEEWQEIPEKMAENFEVINKAGKSFETGAATFKEAVEKFASTDYSAAGDAAQKILDVVKDADSGHYTKSQSKSSR